MTHYTCDRCGRLSIPPTKGAFAEVTIPSWLGDRSLPPRGKTIVVNAEIRGIYDDVTNSPDLCNDCRACILREAASVLDTDSEAAVVS